MADTDNELPLDDISEVVDTIKDVVEDVVPFVVAPMQTVAAKTAYAYGKTVLATALTVPLVASSGAPTISAVHARKPDENIPSQSRDGTVMLEGANLMEGTSVSSIAVNVSDAITVSDDESVTLKTLS